MSLRHSHAHGTRAIQIHTLTELQVCRDRDMQGPLKLRFKQRSGEKGGVYVKLVQVPPPERVIHPFVIGRYARGANLCSSRRIGHSLAAPFAPAVPRLLQEVQFGVGPVRAFAPLPAGAWQFVHLRSLQATLMVLAWPSCQTGNIRCGQRPTAVIGLTCFAPM